MGRLGNMAHFFSLLIFLYKGKIEKNKPIIHISKLNVNAQNIFFTLKSNISLVCIILFK